MKSNESKNEPSNQMKKKKDTRSKLITLENCLNPV